MRHSFQDLNYAWRQLRQSPAFAFVAILTLALGIGANTAIFSVTNAILLRYLPVPNPQQLVYLLGAHRPGNTSQTGDDDFSFTEYTFEQLRNQHQSFSDIVAFVPLGLPTIAVRYGDEAEEARGDMVSGNFFSGLGVGLELGRGFTLQDETQHAQVAVLGYDYWSRRFGRDPSILGQTLYVKGVPFSVVGVAARGFAGVEPVDRKLMDLWIPLQNRPDITAWGNADDHHGYSLHGTQPWWCLMMIGRLKPGVTEKQAAAQMTPLFRNTAYWGGAKHDPKAPLPEIQLRPARGNQNLRAAYEQPVEAMVGVILLIACSNVAMLLMARNTAREREFSLRMALGASGSHLFRQLLTESLLLVGAGAGLGWLFAQWSTRALAAWSQFDVSITPDRTVLLFTLGVSVLAALAFGLAPLRNAVRVSPGLALKSSAAASTQDRKKHRVGRIVVALQVSLCMALLVGAGLLLRSLRNLETANLGLQASGLLAFGVTPPQSLHTDPEVFHFFQAMTARLQALPGVESVTLMENRIGSGWSNNTYAFVDGVLPGGDNDQSLMRWNAVGPGYFSVLQIPLSLGRDLTEADSPAAPKVVVVNHTFAERFLPGRNPLGHRVGFDGAPDPSSKTAPPQYTIVGVAADSRYSAVGEEARPMAYFPYGTLGAIEGIATMHFEVRTAGNPMALLPQVRSLVREFGPDLPLLDPMTQQEQFESSFSQQRLMGRMSIFFAFLAAILVATGLYGTLAYRVSRRTAEIGVRMALGAQRQQVLWMVLRESLMVGAAGLAVGLPLAIAGARLLRSTLFGLGPNDPLSFGAALAGIVIVTLLASLIPARRAASVDPMLALRME